MDQLNMVFVSLRTELDINFVSASLRFCVVNRHVNSPLAVARHFRDQNNNSRARRAD